MQPGKFNLSLVKEESLNKAKKYYCSHSTQLPTANFLGLNSVKEVWIWHEIEQVHGIL